MQASLQCVDEFVYPRSDKQTTTGLQFNLRLAGPGKPTSITSLTLILPELCVINIVYTGQHQSLVP